MSIELEEDETGFIYRVSDDMCVWTTESNGKYGIVFDPRPGGDNMLTFEDMPKFIEALQEFMKVRDEAKRRIDAYYAKENSDD
jgi:hypothetical protein